MIYTVYTEADQAAWDLAAGCASSLHWAMPMWIGSNDGACLIAASHIACILTEHGVDSVAVRGEYCAPGEQPQAHWWLEIAQLNLRLDPTRDQFETVTPLSDTDVISHLDDADARYQELERFASAWTRGGAQAEAWRAVADGDQAPALSGMIFDELDDLAATSTLTSSREACEVAA